MNRDSMTISDIKEHFDIDVANHIMKIVHQNGVYRTIECRQISSVNCSFTIVTTPRYLAYFGDMGSYVFSRNTAIDVLGFFRNTTRTGEEIPYGYWAEKLEAGDYKQFDAQTAVAQAVTMLEQEESLNLAACDYSSLDEIKELLEGAAEDGENEYFAALSDLVDELEVDDWYEHCQRVYKPTYHYIWCCYAILWTIAQYDSTENKEQQNEQV